MSLVTAESWPILLFKKSPLKQRKLREISALLGDTDGKLCLDLGADNGVISYLLRQGRGRWKSADLTDEAVRSIRELVGDDVYLVEEPCLPFGDGEFDCVVIVDMLEHVQDDDRFVGEVFRVLKPGGEVIINVPHLKKSLLKKLRAAIGQTDERHGHIRPGYTLDGLRRLLGDRFAITRHRTYSKFFSEAIDTLITYAFGVLKKEKAASRKGLIVVGEDLQRYRKLFRAYSFIYPIIWLFVQMDRLLFWRSGYMLIAKAKTR